MILKNKLMNWTYCGFKKLSENKGLEVQLTLKKGFAQWLNIALEERKKCDHAGVEFRIELLKSFYFHIQIYDFRHWDYENDKYMDHGDMSFS